MNAVSFECDAADFLAIRKIAERAIRDSGESKRRMPTCGTREYLKQLEMEIEMDVTAVHCNGCPLDLEKLLAFDAFNFAHDINGIRRHLNRQTGKLEDFFLPRCAMRST